MPTASVNGTELWYQVQGEGDPILLLPGLGLDHNYFIPASFSKIIHRAIAHSQYVEIAGGGHIPFIEKPQETAKAVLDFVI